MAGASKPQPVQTGQQFGALTVLRKGSKSHLWAVWCAGHRAEIEVSVGKLRAGICAVCREDELFAKLGLTRAEMERRARIEYAKRHRAARRQDVMLNSQEMSLNRIMAELMEDPGMFESNWLPPGESETRHSYDAYQSPCASYWS